MLKTEQQINVFSDEGDDTLGGRLSSARDAAGISIGSLANQLGVQEETVLAWESDRSEPRPSLLLDLAGIFGVSPIWLMTGAGEGPAEMTDERALEAVKIELSRLQSAYKDMGRLIETTNRQLEKLDYQLKLRNVGKGVAH
ncbi:XRE family transcriptional regulator [Neorhizobium sp. P12A]|uniref:helix-turn-helix domain-containing protein n=1 Tax=Neorhizobium sp. P12A TaxID=2268027 RepID=UPI0011EC68A5|nr:helix-turn-helix transcriptional regulator [Neorhizobium sp. P12A]KAA0697496.1 XRE family transcriptional regulator [Neorhizobium sp. P12A]